jgi:uncharacterized protein (TIGR02996 family)
VTERELLIDAIRRHQYDDTPRLVYADWLDEHAERDFDRATAEFIRLSCRPFHGASYTPPRQACAWLNLNWWRLVPALMAEHCPNFHTEALPGRVVANRVTQVFRFERPRPAAGFRANQAARKEVRLTIHFGRGFAFHVVTEPWCETLIANAFARDGYYPGQVSWAFKRERAVRA